MKRNLYVLACALCTLLSLSSVAQVPGYVPTDGLVGWWPFNGNANDESGNGNDGVVNGATLVEDRFGNADAAFSFDGNSDFIEFNNFFASGSWTASVWVNMTLLTGYIDNQTILVRNENEFWDIAYDQPTNSFSFGIYNNGTWNKLFTTAISSDNWIQLVVSYQDNTMKLFVDGVLAQSETLENLTFVSIGQNLFIGGENGSPNKSIVGSIDDIAIYNRVLTEQEIQNLYSGTTPPPCTALPSNLQQGLVGYWPFCGNANDESGNGNDGVVNGATLVEDRFGNANAAYDF